MEASPVRGGEGAQWGYLRARHSGHEVRHHPAPGGRQEAQGEREEAQEDHSLLVTIE